MCRFRLIVSIGAVFALAACTASEPAVTPSQTATPGTTPTSSASRTADAAPTDTATIQPSRSASGLPPEGTWQVDLTTTELIAAGWPADVTPPGTYTWTFGTDRGTIDVDADDGSQVRCEAEMERTASGFRVTYDDGECGGEVDEIRWELAGDGLHLFLTTTNAPIGQQKAYLETKPWQPVGSD